MSHHPTAPAAKLLYVEDEEITRETVCALLTRRFPSVAIHCAGDGAAGLHLFEHLAPDLVITDIGMPAMDGIEMSRRIRELRPEVPIIVTSAHSDLRYLMEGIDLGISRYVMKPIETDKLFQTVAASLAALRLERELQTQQAARLQASRDIEELNRALSTRAKELEAANRELEGFNYMVSHDLRAPLTAINASSDLILDLHGTELDPQCKAFVHTIYNEAAKMNRLIDALLEFSKAPHVRITPSTTDLSALAAEIAAGLLLTKPQRRVKLEIAPGVTAEGDRDLLQVVLSNLLSNAWKFTLHKEEALIEFGICRIGGENACFVRDNGAGFDMVESGRLFRAFQRLHEEQHYKGFGIGLATVERIVERHGGSVWAEGEVGKGATFYFTLPRLGQRSAESSPP
jgi:two-component system, sensor histidine kinase and response regulator